MMEEAEKTTFNLIMSVNHLAVCFVSAEATSVHLFGTGCVQCSVSNDPAVASTTGTEYINTTCTEY
jgi:hypothetical protein